jgi:hypothetical protein
MVSLTVDTGGPQGVASYAVVDAGLLVTPAPGSGNLFGDASVGMGTTAVGNPRSIQPDAPNEAMIFEIFRSDGVSFGSPEGATDIVLTVAGLPTSNEVRLSAEDKDGNDLGSATTNIVDRTIDVSGLLNPGGEVHKLTVEAISGGATIIKGLDYTHVCLGF